jgi:hypothetical protein
MSRRALLSVVLGGLAVVLLPVVAADGANGHANYHAVCPGPTVGAAHCHELVVTDEHGNPRASTSPSGLSPAAIKQAYGFSTGSTDGAGKTIAIVDAYDDPTAEADLGVFSSHFDLPACTTANGCFKKVSQTGGTTYPRADSGWSLEISLDVQWAHAMAPGAKILLVEASSNSFTNLLAAEDYAKAHAQYVSNSWGGSEFSGESSYDSHFRQSGVSFFVSAGDAGLPAEYPSASPGVISVGGTTLDVDGSGNFVDETGWSDGGGGCSAYESPAPAQSSFSGYMQAGCGGKRATPDVALDADPATGVAVYDSTTYQGQAGWFTVGGTSASSPMWAGRAAVTGGVVDAAAVYGSGITFRDITQGNNGAACLVGYDLCSGRGSWTGAGSGGGGGGGGVTATPPTGLSAVSPRKRQVSLGWHDDGTASSYEVYRGTSSGTETPYASTTTTSYTDRNVTSRTTYYYYVTATGTDGVESGRSNEVSVRAR